MLFIHLCYLVVTLPLSLKKLASACLCLQLQRLCPIGVPGVLVVSGPQVTRGYLNLPDKTAAVFEPNPYACGAGTSTDVMYHTGDLARWLPCGRIECMGRTDHQVRGTASCVLVLMFDTLQHL